MTFPVSIEGSLEVEVPGDLSKPVDAVLGGLVTGLERVRASSIKRKDASVAFKVDFFRFVTKGNLLIPIEGGTIAVEPKDGIVKVTYRLGTIRVLIIASAAALFFLAVSRSFGVGAMAWLGLFGGNYVLAMIRFRWFVRRHVGATLEEWARLAKTA